MEATLIANVKTYNPSKVDDAVLGDDWRIVNAWYAALKQGKKLKHSESVVLDTGVKIMKELLTRGKVTFHPDKMQETSKEFTNNVLKQIVKQKVIVEPPFGDLVYEGKTSGLVFGDDIPLTDIYLLTQDGKALGYVRFGPLKDKDIGPSEGAPFGTYHYKLVGDMFAETRKVHKISDSDRKELWGDKAELWLYPVRDFFPFDKPVQLDTYVSKEFAMPSDFKPEDIVPDLLKRLSNLSLVKLHGWLHAGYDWALKYKQAIERWVNAHAFLVDEMYERKMEHRPWSSLDEKSKEYQIHKMSKVEDYLIDFMVRKPYAMCAGSVFVSGQGNDLDVIIRDWPNEYFREAVEHFLAESNVGRCDFIFSAWTSSFTNHLVLYNYGMTRNPRSEIYLQKIKLWGLNMQLPSFVNPEPKVYMKQEDNKLSFFVREDKSKERDGIVEFKLKQMMPLYYDMEVHYGTYVPKDYKPIYWEVWWREPEPELITMSIAKGRYQAKMAKSSKIKPMKYFNTMKPAKAAEPGEPASLDAFYGVFKPKDFPVALQKKYDGINTEIHRNGSSVKIWTEDGEDITDRVPNTVKEVLSLNHNKFAILAEAEYWDGNFHFPRERTAGYFHSKETPDDSHIVFNVYDVVYTGPDGDISQNNELERLKVLDSFSFKQSTMGVPDLKHRLNKAPTLMAKNLSQLKTHTSKITDSVGAEGVVAKPFWGIYDTSGRRTEQVKFHNKVEFTARVTDVQTTKTPGVHTYSWAVEADGLEPKPKDKIKWDGTTLIYGGHTDSTTEKFKKGDLIGIEAETINYLFDERDGTIRVSAWVPRVMKKTAHPLDSVKTMTSRAKDNKVLSVKVRHDDGTEGYIPQEEFRLELMESSIIAQGVDPEAIDMLSLIDLEVEPLHRSSEMLQRFAKDISVPKDVSSKEAKWNGLSLDEVQGMTPSKFPKGFFVIQHHFRGKSVHDDLRIKDNGTLTGWTISSAWPGKVKAPVESISDAAKVTAQDSVWKFSPDMPPTKHVFSEYKPKHPLEWLTQVKDVHKEGEVGATRFYEGVFYGYDWGLSYQGAGGQGSHNTSKPWFYEYFLRGKHFNGRLVFRLLQAPKDGKIKAGVFWQAWLAKDEYPYVLTRGARLKRDWLPPAGVSALPPEIEALIPPELQYWNKSLSKEAKFDMMDKVYNYLIDEGYIAANRLKVKDTKMSMEGKKVDFILQDEWWQGPEVVRGVKQHRFYVKFKDGTDVQAISFRKEYPITKVEDPGLAATIHKVSSGPLKGNTPADWFTFEGEIPPGNPGHPKEIKELPLHVKILDKADAQVIEDGPTFKSFQFKGSLLKGYYILRREAPDSPLWVWERSKLPAEGGPIK